MTKVCSPEKRQNIRTLFAGGMPVKTIGAAVHMGQKTIRKIVADMPDPHGGAAQKIFARAGQMRRHGIGTGYTFASIDADD